MAEVTSAGIGLLAIPVFFGLSKASVVSTVEFLFLKKAHDKILYQIKNSICTNNLNYSLAICISKLSSIQ
jgi:hypothetical protein